MDVTLLYVLLPRYGIGGYFFSFLITHAINYFLSIRRLLWITKERIHIHIPIATLAVGCAAVWVSGFVAQPVISALAFSVILFCGLFLCGVLSKEDLLWIKGLIWQK
jgi:O-antigen/teichoic acid export membrane protein